MPKGVYKKGKGYKVCEKPPKTKCYSKKPLSKKKAEAQFRAIMANTARESTMSNFNKLIETYLPINEQDEVITSPALDNIKDKALDVLDTINLYQNSPNMPIDPIYGSPEAYAEMLREKLGREISELGDLYESF